MLTGRYNALETLPMRGITELSLDDSLSLVVRNTFLHARINLKTIPTSLSTTRLELVIDQLIDGLMRGTSFISQSLLEFTYSLNKQVDIVGANKHKNVFKSKQTKQQSFRTKPSPK